MRVRNKLKKITVKERKIFKKVLWCKCDFNYKNLTNPFCGIRLIIDGINR